MPDAELKAFDSDLATRIPLQAVSATGALKVSLTEAGGGATSDPPNTLDADQKAVTSSAAEAVASDANRRYVLLKNQGNYTIYLGQNNTQAAAAEGWELLPGEALTLIGTFAIHAIAPAGDSVLGVLDVSLT